MRLLKVIGFILASLFLQNINFAVAAPLTISACDGNPITNTSGICSAIPDVYRMHIYKMGLCNDVGSELDSGIVPDINTKCVTTFDSGSASVSVDIRDNISDPVSGGTVTAPPNNLYHYGYVLIENRADIKAVKTFTSLKDGQHSGRGLVCWSIRATANSQFSDPTTKCGNELDTSSYGFVSSYWDNLEADPTATPIFFSPYTEGNLDPTYAYLMNGEIIATSTSSVNRMLGFARFITPKTVDDSTSTMEVLFRVKRGLSVNQMSGNGSVGFYSYEFKTITNLR